jgi:hypothetical protein
VLLVRRAIRRIKGWFWSIVYAMVSAWKWVGYALTMRTLGASEQYIREAFSYLAQLDIDEFVDAGRLKIKCWGNEVHIVHHIPVSVSPESHIQGDFLYVTPLKYECVITENWNRQLIVHEWRDVQREVSLEYGSKHKTNWYEVFRSGRHVQNLTFVKYLRELYGEGPNVVHGKTGKIPTLAPEVDGAEVPVAASQSDGTNEAGGPAEG